jgi:hypothetical protein
MVRFGSETVRERMKSSVHILAHHPRNQEIYTLSNIEDLVQSIGDVGLLSPLVIDKKNQVISGNRRLSAIRELGWNQVEVEVVDIPEEDVVGILIHHNKQRVKSTREILNEYFALEKIHGIGQGHRTDLDTFGKSTKGDVARDIIAEKIGLSSSQMGRLLFIEKKNPDFIKLIDDGTLTINKARQHLSDGHKYTFAHGEDGNNNDFYSTPYSVTEHLFRIEKFNKNLTVCEPATGKNAIADVLRKHWNPDLVTAYDLEVDFFKDENDYDYIITNPPFSKATEFIIHAKKRARHKICLLLPLNYLHGKQRYNEIYTDKQYGLSKVHIFTRSILLNDGPIRPDGKVKNGMLVFAWYIFENGYQGSPIISWIDNGADLISG